MGQRKNDGKIPFAGGDCVRPPLRRNSRIISNILTIVTLIGLGLLGQPMVLMLGGSSEHVAQAGRNTVHICDGCRSTQIPDTDQITNLSLFLRTYF